MSEARHLLGFHMHQPPGNLKLLVDTNEWEARQIMLCYDRPLKYALALSGCRAILRRVLRNSPRAPLSDLWPTSGGFSAQAAYTPSTRSATVSQEKADSTATLPFRPIQRAHSKFVKSVPIPQATDSGVG